MANNLTPTVVKQRTFNTDEISRRADPEWMRDRNYLTAYKFNLGKRTFVDNRNRVYSHSEEE
jgi:hypothetical protein